MPRGLARRVSGLAFQVRGLRALARGLLLGALGLVLDVALALLTTALAVGTFVTGQVADSLLHAACDLVRDAAHRYLRRRFRVHPSPTQAARGKPKNYVRFVAIFSRA